MNETLSVLLKIQSDTAGLRAAKSDLSGFMSALGAVRGIAGALAVPLTVGAFVGSLAQMSEKAVQLAEDIERVRGAIGLSGEAFQVYASILRDANQNADSLVPALGNLQKKLGEAFNGSSEAASSFREIGVSLEELRGQSLDSQFNTVAAALAGIADVNQRAALSAELLGKAYRDLNPLIDLLAKVGFAELREQVERVTGIMSDPMAKAIDDAGDRSENAGRRIANALAPAQLRLRELTADFKEFLATILETSKPTAKPLFETLLGQASSAQDPEQMAKVLKDVQNEIARLEVERTRTTARSKVDIPGLLEDAERQDLAERQLENFRALERSIISTGAEQIRQNQALEAEKQHLQVLNSLNGKRTEERKEAAKGLESLVEKAKQLNAALLSPEDRLAKLNAQFAELSSKQGRTAEDFLPLGGTKDPKVQQEAENAALAEKLRIQTSIADTLRDIRAVEKEIADSAQRDAAEKKRQADKEIRDAKELTRLRAQSEQGAFGRRINSLEGQANRIQASPFLTDIEKQRAVTPILEEQNRLITERIELLEQQRDAESDPAAAVGIQGQIDGLGRQQADVDGRIAQNTPLSFGEDLEAQLTELENSFNRIAVTIADTIGGALETITQQISGLILGTQTWESAIRNIGSAILSEVVTAIVRMVVQWTIGRATISLLNKVFGKGDQQVSAQMAMASAAMWAPAATAASIASYGGAAASGMAAFIAALAAGTIASTGIAAGAMAAGFEVGGYTGDGPSNQPAGIVHAGEWVAPQWMVKSPAFGPAIASLENVRVGRGYMDGGHVTSPQLATTTPAAESMGRSSEFSPRFYLDRDQLRRSILEDPDSETYVVNVMDRNMHRYG